MAIGKRSETAPLKWLFLDLNSYFASVEQQENPAIRGKPVIVVPVITDSTCAIAASYEAKAFGITTGTRVGDAKRLCRELILVPARHDLYVDYHHRIIEEIELHLPVTKVCSIDEVACELIGAERYPQNAVAIAGQIKKAIAAKLGPHMRSSIGLGPSQLLAKIASDLQKPDGLTMLHAADLPGRLLELELIDLPGIGRKMRQRLEAAGILSVEAFWALSPSRARAIWGGIGGERFWYALRGIDPPDIPATRSSIGHSHVLSPDLRAPDLAFGVARRLTAKAASRLRRMAYRTAGLTLSARLEKGWKAETGEHFPLTSDSFALLAALELCCNRMGRELNGLHVRKIGITLSGLSPIAEDQPDLFDWTPAKAENLARLELSNALDRLNSRYGRDTITIGAGAALPRYTGAKVAFNRIPDRAEFRE